MSDTYRRLFLHSPVHVPKIQEVKGSVGPPTEKDQRFEEYVADVQAGHDERSFWREFKRERALEEEVICRFSTTQREQFGHWLRQHDLNEIEGKKQRIKDKKKHTSPAYKMAMEAARRQEYEEDETAWEIHEQEEAARQEREEQEAADAVERLRKRREADEVVAGFRTAISARSKEQQDIEIARLQTTVRNGRPNPGLSNSQQASERRPQQEDESAATIPIFGPRKQPSDEEIRIRQELHDNIEAMKRNTSPNTATASSSSSSPQNPAPVTWSFGSPKPIDEPQRYDWEKRVLREILTWLEAPQPQGSRGHPSHLFTYVEDDCGECYERMLRGKDWMKARLKEIEAGYTSMVRGWYDPEEVVEYIRRGWSWKPDE